MLRTGALVSAIAIATIAGAQELPPTPLPVVVAKASVIVVGTVEEAASIIPQDDPLNRPIPEGSLQRPFPIPSKELGILYRVHVQEVIKGRMAGQGVAVRMGDSLKVLVPGPSQASHAFGLPQGEPLLLLLSEGKFGAKDYAETVVYRSTARAGPQPKPDLTGGYVLTEGRAGFVSMRDDPGVVATVKRQLGMN